MFESKLKNKEEPMEACRRYPKVFRPVVLMDHGRDDGSLSSRRVSIQALVHPWDETPQLQQTLPEAGSKIDKRSRTARTKPLGDDHWNEEDQDENDKSTHDVESENMATSDADSCENDGETMSYDSLGASKKGAKRAKKTQHTPQSENSGLDSFSGSSRKPGTCLHDRRKSWCKDCGGSGICDHGRRRHLCKDCGGSGICGHGRQKHQCKDCGGSGICAHGRQKHLCKYCGGSSICEHGRRKHQCKDCGGSSICEHGRRKHQCKDCGGSGICEHGRRKQRCKLCSGREIRGTVGRSPYTSDMSRAEESAHQDAMQGSLEQLDTHLRPWQEDVSMQGLWGQLDLQSQQVGASVQGLFGEELRSRQAEASMQGFLGGGHLPARQGQGQVFIDELWDQGNMGQAARQSDPSTQAIWGLHGFRQIEMVAASATSTASPANSLPTSSAGSVVPPDEKSYLESTSRLIKSFPPRLPRRAALHKDYPGGQLSDEG